MKHLIQSLFALFVLLCAASLEAATYYIDFNASGDTANGTSTSTPWKRCPGMQGFAGSYVHANGDRFIFKGGVTWPSSALPLDIPNQGVSGNRDYYGVDLTWFNGGAWTRPKFDGEYADSYLINIGSRAHLDFDRLELKRVTSSGKDGYGLIIGFQPSQITITGCYLHGWRTTNNADGAHGGLIMTNFGPGVDTLVFIGGEIENSENPGQVASGGNGVMVRMWGTLKNSSFHHNSSAILFCLDFDNNDIYNISGAPFDFYLGNEAYHTNGVYLDALTLGKTVAYIRNSRFRDCGGGSNMAYLNGRFATLYCYNNVFWGDISAQCAVEIEPFDYGGNVVSGVYHVYNNTGFIEPSTPFIHIVTRTGGLPRPSSIVIRNNHVIGTSVTLDDNGPSSSYTRSNNIIHTPTQASGQGYVIGNIWAPTDIADATVNVGFNGAAALPTAVDNDGTVRPQGAAWDVGAHEFVEVPSAGSVQFTAAAASVNENGTSLTLTASRTGGSTGAISVAYETVNGSAMAGSDYTALSGIFNWANADAANKSVALLITNDATFEGNEALTARLITPTGGALLGTPNEIGITIVEDDSPVIPEMLTNPWEAEDGWIEPPFTESATLISQSVQTTVPGDGGRARYIFDVPVTGDYTMKMMVNAPDDSANSLFLDWDNEPTSPTTIWDVLPTTTGVQERAVSWRGTGTFDTPQFPVKTFTLAAGLRTLYIRGREAGMQIDSIELVSLVPADTAAPTPDPATWSVVPFSLGPSDISMMATTASDPSIPVLYEFDETSGNPGGSDSGLQTSAFYTDRDLNPNTQYTYRVRVVDSAPTPNATAYSSSQSATTAVLPTAAVGVANTDVLITD